MSTNLSLVTSTVSMKRGQAVCNSRAVAEVFGKRHDNILQAIDRLECSRQFIDLNFQASNYKDPRGRILRSLDMTKDGFVFLVMGFTGRDAARFKEAYIQRFNEMEAELRGIHRSSHLGNVTAHEFFLGEHRLRALATERGPFVLSVDVVYLAYPNARARGAASGAYTKPLLLEEKVTLTRQDAPSGDYPPP